MPGTSVVIPNPRIPSVLGTLNIVFGILLLIASAAVVGWTLAAPHVADMVVSPDVQQQRANRRREVTAQLAELKKQVDAERDPNLRARLTEEIEMLEDEQASDEFTTEERSRANLKDPHVAVPFWADHLLGIVLNALMIASGAGLVALRPWGRKLAISVAALKIGKLAILTLVAVFLTVPHQAVQSRRMWAKLEARSHRAAPFGSSMGTQVAQIAAISSTIFAVSFGITGMIYPALLLWLLNKQNVRAALHARKPRASRQDAGVAPADLS